MYAEIVCRENIPVEGQHTILIDRPDLAIDVEGGRVEGDLYAGGKGLHAGGDIGGIERLIGTGRNVQA